MCLIYGGRIALPRLQQDKARIKERIDETNWREVLTLTKDIIGLDNTTGAALEPIFK